MGIHAKSLNCLADELHARSMSRESKKPESAPRDGAKFDPASELTEFKKYVADLCSSPDATKALMPEATAPVARKAVPPKDFRTNSTLGVRTQLGKDAEVRKRESDIRLYSGFASRSDITRKG